MAEISAGELLVRYLRAENVNLVAGISDGAHIPIIATAAPRARIESDPNRGGTWQADDAESMARPITRCAATVRQWRRLPEMVRAAFRAAMTGRPGPVDRDLNVKPPGWEQFRQARSLQS